MITRQYLKSIVDNYESHDIGPISLELEENNENTKIITQFMTDDYERNEAWLEDFLGDNNITEGYDLDVEEVNGQVNNIVIFSNAYLDENEELLDENNTIQSDISNLNKASNLQSVGLSDQNISEKDISTKSISEDNISDETLWLENSIGTRTVDSQIQSSRENVAAFVDTTVQNKSVSNTSNKSSDISSKPAPTKKLSAFKQVHSCLANAIPKLTDDHITNLTSKEYCKTNAGLGYPLLLEVNTSMKYKDQVKMNGKSRYAKNPITILNRSFYITNHLFERNVIRIQKMLDEL